MPRGVNRFLLGLSFVLQSKKRMKFIGNLVLLNLALIFVALFLLWTYQKEIVNEVGGLIVSGYTRQFDSEWEATMLLLRVGGTRPAIELLEKKKWSEIQYGDRVYGKKRALLSALAAQLHMNEQFEALFHWSAIWRQLDERDVTAMAYWYEALRHTPDRREEGLRGLEREWQRFPSNDELTKFQLTILSESGDKSAVAELRSRHQRRWIEANLKGWRASWHWRIQHALARPVGIELAAHLRSWQLIVAWHDVVGVFRSLRVWLGDRNQLKRTGSIDFSISPDDKGWVQISLPIPKFMTTLRIDPPHRSKLGLSDIQIVVNEAVHSILISQLVDQRHYHSMVRKEDVLVTLGEEDPWVRINVVDIIAKSEGQSADVILRFRVSFDVANL